MKNFNAKIVIPIVFAKVFQEKLSISYRFFVNFDRKTYF